MVENSILKYSSCNVEHGPIFSLPTGSPKFHKLSVNIAHGIGTLSILGCEAEAQSLPTWFETIVPNEALESLGTLPSLFEASTGCVTKLFCFLFNHGEWVEKIRGWGLTISCVFIVSLCFSFSFFSSFSKASFFRKFVCQ